MTEWKNIKVADEKVCRWLADDPRLIDLICFVASYTSKPLRLEIYHDYEENFEELHIVVETDEELEDYIDEWKMLTEELVGRFPRDLRAKVGVLYGK